MSIHIALQHRTVYQYDQLVQLGPQLVRLKPCAHARSPVLSYRIEVEPKHHFVHMQQDVHGNFVHRLVFPERTDIFALHVDLLVDMSVFNPFDFFIEPDAERWPFRYSDTLFAELELYRRPVGTSESIQSYLNWGKCNLLTMEALVGLNKQVGQDIRYIIRHEPGVQSPEETMRLGTGSCRDSAWLLVEILRHLGLASRFVSGYLIQLKPDERPVEGPAGAAEDFCDLHAWCEVYVPGAGWIGLDPTSGLLAGEGHIPLACAATPDQAAPVSGVLSSCSVAFSHRMSVQRIMEIPRVSKPYTDTQWDDILALGDVIDQHLQNGDVRLSMGGEPTFVSAEYPDAPEWNTEALGAHKRERAHDLFTRLCARYAPQGLVHKGQGKWYPGELLPRWSLNCFWRKDGVPIWSDPALLVNERLAGRDDVESARSFIQQLSALLDLGPLWTFPAYEDVYYLLWQERNLPVNVDPFEIPLDDAQERARLARILEQGLDKPTGWVLPLQHCEGTWQSGPWYLRRERCYLLPGDSPMGYRLPLESLPWVAERDRAQNLMTDPAEPRSPLPQYGFLQERLRARITGTQIPDIGISSAGTVRTALCVEPRQGHLYVFMPPLQQLDDYLALVHIIEQTCRILGTQVIIEGYEPPQDPRLECLRITPDPGVVEVNIHPAYTWRELVEQTTHLYAMAQQARLRAEKFMLDGRHTGTGGGHHLVLGAGQTLDSPFLRRPDLLRSMLSFWQHHPSLSYLFSGLFIGPTSQAPRIDEARHESLAELELAFKTKEHRAPHVPPWLTDRIFRNILVDVTGNTHRAEFCIDKLYNPDSVRGRLGLLELRSFEMQPHARMALVQQLLVRALVARFWEQPYNGGRLVRWGGQLHDRMMLPYFLQDDLHQVLDDLARAGFAFDPEWFKPHLEFRCPLIGTVHIQGVEIELRQALEPWLVLGEEGSSGGTVRYVDSSTERIQIYVRGTVGERYQVTVNQVLLPLYPGPLPHEAVAGVRFRAWRPASAMHPTLPVDSPLVIELYDRWNQRSMGGCVYHVMHPGGRNDQVFPVNAFEAESRRLARFSATGHSVGNWTPIQPETLLDSPYTLDLRTIRTY